MRTKYNTGIKRVVALCTHPCRLCFPIFSLILLTPNSLLRCFFFSPASFIFFFQLLFQWLVPLGLGAPAFPVPCFLPQAEPGWAFLCDAREHAGPIGKSTLRGRVCAQHGAALLAPEPYFGWAGNTFSSQAG